MLSSNLIRLKVMLFMIIVTVSKFSATSWLLCRLIGEEQPEVLYLNKNAAETPFIEKLTGDGYLDSMSRHSSSHLMIPDLWRLSKLCNCVPLMMCWPWNIRRNKRNKDEHNTIPTTSIHKYYGKKKDILWFIVKCCIFIFISSRVHQSTYRTGAMDIYHLIKWFKMTFFNF